MIADLKVLVLDGYSKQSLVIVRSLGSKGIEVHCGSSRRMSMALHSKYCRRKVFYPDPSVDPEGFVRFLAQYESEHGGTSGLAIIPCSDSTVQTMAWAHRTGRFRAKIQVLPELEMLESATDKLKTFDLCERLGIPYPRTWRCMRPEDLETFQSELTFPLIVKPRHTFRLIDGRGFKDTASVVHTHEEAVERFTDFLTRSGEAPIVQEYVSGDEYGVGCLFSRGKESGMVAYRRLRSLSAAGGASTYRETVRMDPGLHGASDSLLSGLGWHGPAMVEFKKDRRDGTYRVIEINARFWGALFLSHAAGMDFPWMWFRMLRNEQVPPVREYATGLKARHLLGDLQHYRSKRSFSLKDAASFLRVFRPDEKVEVLSWVDPIPAFVEIGAYVRGLVRSRARRRKK